MKTILNIFGALAALAGTGMAINAANAPNEGYSAGSGAAAGGLFVCLGLCLYSLTKLEIAERQAARDQQRQK